MNEQEELKMLRIRCKNLEESYRKGYPATVATAREQGFQAAVDELKDRGFSEYDDAGNYLDENSERILKGIK